MKNLLICLSTITIALFAKGQIGSKINQRDEETDVNAKIAFKPKTLFGVASYYADKFDGRPTASGETYNHEKFTAACNVLPLGTWIRVTNLSNSKSVVVKTNDRLHIRMKRLVDLSRSAAEMLGYTKRGLTQVKVEVLEIIHEPGGSK